MAFIKHKSPNRGAKNGMTSLTDAQVRSIRAMFDRGATPTQIQLLYASTDTHMGIETIRRIGKRQSWGWLSEEVTQEQLDTALPDLPPVPKMEVEASLARLEHLRGANLANELLTGKKTNLSPELQERLKAYGWKGGGR